MKDLQILNPSITHTFHSPLAPNLVRTGVISDGSCFFHALYHAISSDYRNLPVADKVQYIHNVRKNLVKSCSFEDITSIGGGELFRMLAVEKFRDHQSKHFGKYLKKWDDEILPDICNKWKSTSMTDCGKILESFGLKPDFIIHLIKIVVDEVYIQFMRHLLFEWVDEFMIEIISKKFEMNFVFINSSTRKIYNIFAPTHFQQQRNNLPITIH